MKRSKLISIMLLCCTMLLLSGCCLQHEWQEASCTTPAICIKCEKTEGEALGHEEGEIQVTDVNWVTAKETFRSVCPACSEELQQGSRPLEQLHDGKTFLPSASQLFERFQFYVMAFSSGDYKAGLTTGNNGEIIGQIQNLLSLPVGSILYQCEHNDVFEEESEKESIITNLACYASGEDAVVTVLPSLLCSLDPTLESDVWTLAAELLENEMVSHGGILYFTSIVDGDLYILVELES